MRKGEQVREPEAKRQKREEDMESRLPNEGLRGRGHGPRSGLGIRRGREHYSGGGEGSSRTVPNLWREREGYYPSKRGWPYLQRGGSGASSVEAAAAAPAEETVEEVEPRIMRETGTAAVVADVREMEEAAAAVVEVVQEAAEVGRLEEFPWEDLLTGPEATM
jgi:hypothetical protein